MHRHVQHRSCLRYIENIHADIHRAAAEVALTMIRISLISIFSAVHWLPRPTAKHAFRTWQPRVESSLRGHIQELNEPKTNRILLTIRLHKKSALQCMPDCCLANDVLASEL